MKSRGNFKFCDNSNSLCKISDYFNCKFATTDLHGELEFPKSETSLHFVLAHTNCTRNIRGNKLALNAGDHSVFGFALIIHSTICGEQFNDYAKVSIFHIFFSISIEIT